MQPSLFTQKLKVSAYIFFLCPLPTREAGGEGTTMSNTVEIDFEIEYLSCELADERIESKPVLTTYFDAHFIRSEAEGGVINTHLDEHDLGKVYEGTLKAKTPTTAAIPITSAIGFASYAQRRNEFGMACYTNAGTGHVKMVEIMDGMRTSGGTYEKRIPLIMETTKLLGEPVKKGEILFRVKDVRRGNKVAFLPLERCILGDLVPPSASGRGGDGGGSNSLASEVESFIQRRVEFESSMKDTWPGIKNVRAPMDISSAGIELLGTCFVPVEGFALGEDLVVNEEYFQNAFEITMHRHGYTNASVDFRALDLAHKAEIMAEICMYAAQSFDYISDTVELTKREVGVPPAGGAGGGNTKAFVGAQRSQGGYRRIGFEDFHNSNVSFSGDCEDSGRSGAQFFYSFRKMHIDAHAYPELAELQSISEDYIAFLTLATVHGARVNDGVERVGAHMYALFLPRDQVKSCLATTIEGRVWAERLPLAQKNDALPTLFGEGTGRIRPLGTGPVKLHSFKEHILTSHLIGARAAPEHPLSYDPLYDERRYVAMGMAGSRGGLKALISHDWGTPSNFYLGNLMVLTSEFMEVGENIGSFICGKIDRENNEITRGSEFTALIRQENTVALIPLEPLTDRVMELTRESATLRAPSRPFILERGKIKPQDKTHPELERLKRTINGLGRKGVAPHGGVGTYMRRHHISKQSIDRMIADIQNMRAVFKVDVEFEPITTETHQWRVVTYVDHSLM